MSHLKCKYCGGKLDVIDSRKMIGQCDSCGSKVLIPSIDDEKVDLLFKHGNTLRMKSEFDKSKGKIENVVHIAKVGEIYDAKVVRLESFGAFVELFPGTDGLLHVSKISYERVSKPSDILKMDEVVQVIVTEVDEKGRVSVSRKDLLPKPEGYVKKPQG